MRLFERDEEDYVLEQGAGETWFPYILTRWEGGALPKTTFFIAAV